MLDTQKEFATKAFYAAVGAPVVYTKKFKSYSGKLSEFGDKFTGVAHDAYDEWAAEGEKVVENFQDRKVVEEFQSRVDLEKVQEQVEKLRDQLESALHNWRESFSPEEAAKKPAAEKPAAKAAPKHVGGGWYELPDGTRVQGKEAALKAMA